MKQMKKKILVVEDNLLLSGILRKWLKQADYEVLTAGDEPTARKLICKCSCGRLWFGSACDAFLF